MLATFQISITGKIGPKKTAENLHKMVYNLMANIRLTACVICLWTRPVLLLLANY